MHIQTCCAGEKQLKDVDIFSMKMKSPNLQFRLKYDILWWFWSLYLFVLSLLHSLVDVVQDLFTTFTGSLHLLPLLTVLWGTTNKQNKEIRDEETQRPSVSSVNYPLWYLQDSKKKNFLSCLYLCTWRCCPVAAGTWSVAASQRGWCLWAAACDTDGCSRLPEDNTVGNI